jgi:hypothetical protein
MSIGAIINDQLQGHGHEIRDSAYGSFASWGSPGGNDAVTGNDLGDGAISTRRFQATTPFLPGGFGIPRMGPETNPVSSSALILIAY